MADFNGVPLWSDSPDHERGGVILYLREPATDDVLGRMESAEVRVTAGSRCIVVTGLTSADHEAALGQGLDVANKALDVMAIGGDITASLSDPDLGHITWIETTDGMVARIYATSPLPIRTGIPRVVVRDADGNVISQAPAAPPTWVESYRYFRLAQVTDDLFDAFRNIYLAIESLLSTIEPQKLNPDGRPAEKEGTWFRRALAAAAQHVDLKNYTSAGQSGSALKDFYTELYIDTRTSVFHAKAGRPRSVPLQAPARQQVLDSLKRASRFFVDLSEKVGGAHFKSGGVYPAGFKMLVAPLLAAGQLHLSDDQSPIEPMSQERPDASYFTAELSPVPDLKQPRFIAVGAEIDGADLSSAMPFVTRVSIGNSPAKALVAHSLEGRLNVRGLRRLQVVIGVRGSNTRMLRDRYGA